MEVLGLGAEEAIARVAARREVNITPAHVDLLNKIELS
jgi:hypothetical protein